MKLSAQTYAIIAGLAIFIGLPLLLYTQGDAPRRSLLKEGISIATLLAFTLMLGQFFLARSNETLTSLVKPLQIQNFHKYIAYSAVTVILLHPALIVLPRALEGGIKPWDAFVTTIFELGNLGVVLGLISWVLLLVLGTTAYFRKNIIKRLSTRYRGWRYFHGGLAVSFTVLALWHSIALGRHTDVAMALFFIGLAVLGFAMLAHMYWGSPQKTKPAKADPEGAAT